MTFSLADPLRGRRLTDAGPLEAALSVTKYSVDAGGSNIGTTAMVETDTVTGNRCQRCATATVRSPNGSVEASLPLDNE